MNRMQRWGVIVVMLLVLYGCRSSEYAVQRSHIELERVADEAYHGDKSVDELIAPYRAQLEAKMNEVIGQLDMELNKAQPQSTLGNWLADMIYDEIRDVHKEDIDFALQNQGSIRVPQVAAGPITRGKIFEVMPFDNKITILKMKGADLREALNVIARDGGWPISRSVSFVIGTEGAEDITIHGEKLDLDQQYTLALPDYVANVNADDLKHVERRDLDVLIRDVYINHIKRETENGLTQSAQIDNRVKAANHE